MDNPELRCDIIRLHSGVDEKECQGSDAGCDGESTQIRVLDVAGLCRDEFAAKTVQRELCKFHVRAFQSETGNAGELPDIIVLQLFGMCAREPTILHSLANSVDHRIGGVE